MKNTQNFQIGDTNLFGQITPTLSSKLFLLLNPRSGSEMISLHFISTFLT